VWQDKVLTLRECGLIDHKCLACMAMGYALVGQHIVPLVEEFPTRAEDICKMLGACTLSHLVVENFYPHWRHFRLPGSSHASPIRSQVSAVVQCWQNGSPIACLPLPSPQGVISAVPLSRMTCSSPADNCRSTGLEAGSLEATGG